MRKRTYDFSVLFLSAALLLLATQRPVLAQAAPQSHLYFFTNDGCAPCRQVEPAIEALHREGFPVSIIKISDQPDVADRFQVDRTPTVVLVTGNQITGRHAGQISLPTLREWFAAVGQRPQLASSASAIARPQRPAGKTRPEAGTKVVIDAANRAAPASLSSRSSINHQNSSADFHTPTMLRGTANPGNGYEARAMAATVRLKVEDPEGISYATGTVIHAVNNEALVMTCGHVFRDAGGKGVITAEYGFADGNVTSVPGTLIQYDSDAKDIGLVAIQTKHPLTAVPVAMASASVNRGDNAFSIGCDHGQPPTIRRSAIKNRAAYDGEIKYDIYGRPVDGRSGGGLFTDRGELIGICNAAAVEVDEGIYSALDTIHWQLAETKLDHLFADKTNAAVAAIEQPLTGDRFASNASDRDSFAKSLAGQPSVGDMPRAPVRTRIQPRQQLAVGQTQPRPRQTRVGLQSEDFPNSRSQIATPAASDMEVIILVRSKSDPSVSETITVQNPGPSLLSYLGQMNASTAKSRQLDVAHLRKRIEYTR